MLLYTGTTYCTIMHARSRPPYLFHHLCTRRASLFRRRDLGFRCRQNQRFLYYLYRCQAKELPAQETRQRRLRIVTKSLSAIIIYFTNLESCQQMPGVPVGHLLRTDISHQDHCKGKIIRLTQPALAWIELRQQELR